MSRRKRFRPPPRPKSFYELAEVRKLIADGAVEVRTNARNDARCDFDWERADILDTYTKLRAIDFYKSEPSLVRPGITLDVYKARVKGEEVYTHFYLIDYPTRTLIINSFKRI